MFAGVISDTHGLLRKEAVQALAGAEHIFHAGDIGGPEILAALGKIAPVTAVRGNVDRERWSQFLPLAEAVEFGGVTIYVLHDRAELDLDPAAAGFGAVVTGHSHVPLAETHNGVLYLNPGSAGPRRFRLPISVARLHVEGKTLRAELVQLAV
jgi:putative phosphoesterase